MHGDELMALLIMLSLFALIFGIFYIRNRENMALIERGINPRNQKSFRSPFGSLKYGLLIMGAGAGLLAAFFVDINLNHESITINGDHFRKDYEQIYPAFIALGGGLGLVISYFIEKKWLERIKDKIEE